jgi:two-component system OmpR family response regulator
MASPAQLLVVSPDSTLLRVVQRCIESLGHEPVAARTVAQARRTLSRLHIDVLCLDSVLPPDDIERLYNTSAATNGSSPRTVFFGPPAAKLVLAALPPFLRGKLDGFVAKPIDAIDVTRELARVLSGCTATPRRGDLLRVGGIALDGLTYQLLFSEGGALALTPMEYKLLRYLMEHQGQHIPAADLLEQVWGYPRDSAPELVRAHVSNVRKKLRKIGAEGLLLTMPYHGYAFVPPASS